MLRLDNKQPSLWESVLPPELFEMSEELTKIDRILDDERFFAPFSEKFYSRVGRERRKNTQPFYHQADQQDR